MAEDAILHDTSDNVQWKVDKIRALHTLRNHDEVEKVYDDFAEDYDEARFNINNYFICCK